MFNAKSMMKKHLIALVAAAIFLAPAPRAEAAARIANVQTSLAEDIGSVIISRIKPTVPPHAPRNLDRSPILAGRFAGSTDGIFLLVPQSLSGVDLTVMDTGSGSVATLTLASGFHFVPFQMSGSPVVIQGLSDDGIVYDGTLGEE